MQLSSAAEATNQVAKGQMRNSTVMNPGYGYPGPSNPGYSYPGPSHPGGMWHPGHIGMWNTWNQAPEYMSHSGPWNTMYGRPNVGFGGDFYAGARGLSHSTAVHPLVAHPSVSKPSPVCSAAVHPSPVHPAAEVLFSATHFSATKPSKYLPAKMMNPEQNDGPDFSPLTQSLMGGRSGKDFPPIKEQVHNFEFIKD